MQFDHSFDVPLPPGEAWVVLLDVPRIAPCFPGAELTETLGDDHYRGRAGVKVGPVNLFFAGQAQIIDRDDAAKTAKVSAMVSFALVAEGSGSRVHVSTNLNMTGAVAQYGRASGLMKEIAGALIAQFAENLAVEIQGGEEGGRTRSAQPVSAMGLLGKAIKARVAGVANTKKDPAGD